jgi:pilus assembly protein Flp/PilA
MKKFVRFMNDESGATAIEYGLIAAAMGLMLVLVLPNLSTAISEVFTSLTTGMDTVVAP